MPSKELAEKWAGKWIRFYRDGQLIMGSVQYVMDNPHHPWGVNLVTDKGVCHERDVLEAR